MVPGILKLVFRSIRFYRRPVLYQILIIALLSAVITGSLLTDRSVKTSLKRTASEHLGNTGILISSGSRYFDMSLVRRIKEITKINCTGILEITGYSQKLNTQKGVFNTHIFAIGSDFFQFHDHDNMNIKSGEVAVNEKLANYLGLKTGDELIIRFSENSEIPADVPFAPSKQTGRSLVMRVGSIVGSAATGNFSLSISQIIPMNIFINLSDIIENPEEQVKINRLLVENIKDFSTDKVSDILKQAMKPSDIGLNINLVKKTGGFELSSDRVFIDNSIISEIQKVFPASAPVITYLGNRFISGSGSTPYSFVSALPSSIYPEICQGDNIIINRWLADDLAVNQGDTIEMFWYSPDSLNKLTEKNDRFLIDRIVEMHGIWADSMLMPDFPGISGSETCSDWDAGSLVKLDDIRRKDEEYWNKFKGTPKAFINYEKGKEMWGNNFGPATALRFPTGISGSVIDVKLSGSLAPDRTGFTVTNLSEESVKAANGSVDFSTLFLSLSFFLILASIVLLSFAVKSYFDSKQAQISTYYALGFKSGWIEQLFLTESGLIVFIGCFFGAFAGSLVNILIINALNSVWRGAVQTDTLNAFFSLTSILAGFFITLIIAIVFLILIIKSHLKSLASKKKVMNSTPSTGRNLSFLLMSFFISVALYSLSRFLKDAELMLCFASGCLLLIFMILSWRQFLISPTDNFAHNRKADKRFSWLYYSFYPSFAITPVVFIATGIFAVFITGANRMNFEPKQSVKPSGGTGGYLLWCESTIPVIEDMNALTGKKTLGLDDEHISEMTFVLAKRATGNDASCLNLNHVTAPPLLGIDPSEFISRGSFSFSKSIVNENIANPWQFLNLATESNTIYGIADQTVLQWGLKIKPGDTLTLRAENGQPLNIIIAAGLKSSVFQGHVIIGIKNFVKYYPSVSGTSVMLVRGDPRLTDLYKSALSERLDNYGINIELTNDRLASFYEVTNTYLAVFGVFGALGMITGIAGLGFVLLRNYNFRKREFALMMAIGFSVNKIRRMILSEQMVILIAGITSGVIPAVVATLPSLRSSPDVPWLYLIVMVSAILLTGSAALVFSVRAVTNDSLITSLKKE